MQCSKEDNEETIDFTTEFLELLLQYDYECRLDYEENSQLNLSEEDLRRFFKECSKFFQNPDVASVIKTIKNIRFLYNRQLQYASNASKYYWFILADKIFNRPSKAKTPEPPILPLDLSEKSRSSATSVEPFKQDDKSPSFKKEEDAVTAKFLELLLRYDYVCHLDYEENGKLNLSEEDQRRFLKECHNFFRNPNEAVVVKIIKAIRTFYNRHLQETSKDANPSKVSWFSLADKLFNRPSTSTTTKTSDSRDYLNNGTKSQDSLSIAEPLPEDDIFPWSLEERFTASISKVNLEKESDMAQVVGRDLFPEFKLVPNKFLIRLPTSFMLPYSREEDNTASRKCILNTAPGSIIADSMTQSASKFSSLATSDLISSTSRDYIFPSTEPSTELLTRNSVVPSSKTSVSLSDNTSLLPSVGTSFSPPVSQPLAQYEITPFLPSVNSPFSSSANSPPSLSTDKSRSAFEKSLLSPPTRVSRQKTKLRSELNSYANSTSTSPFLSAKTFLSPSAKTRRSRSAKTRRSRSAKNRRSRPAKKSRSVYRKTALSFFASMASVSENLNVTQFPACQ